MKKNFLDTEAWKIIRTALEILLLAAMIWGIVYVIDAVSYARSEEASVWPSDDDILCEEMFVICMPGDFVNVRSRPNKGGEVLGRMECGDTIWWDGTKRNGYLHLVYLGLETDEGWISCGYVVGDKPEYLNRNATIVSKGRLAARKNVGGRRTRWLKPLATVKIYYWSDEWALTNCGYVKSEYLELEGEE